MITVPSMKVIEMKRAKLNQNETASAPKSGEKQQEFSIRPSLKDLAQGWRDFSPKVPLTYSIDARRAAKLKNS